MSTLFKIVAAVVMTGGLVFSVTNAIYYDKLKEGVSGVLTSTESSVLFWISIVMAIIFGAGLIYTAWHLIYNVAPEDKSESVSIKKETAEVGTTEVGATKVEINKPELPNTPPCPVVVK